MTRRVAIKSMGSGSDPPSAESAAGPSPAMAAKDLGGAELENELRRAWREIRELQRELWRNPAPPEKSTGKNSKQTKAEPKPDISEPVDESRGAKLELLSSLEATKQDLDRKYEETFAKPYQPTPEHRVRDFLEMYFRELDTSGRRNTHYLQRLYDPAASLLLVGVTSLQGRELIATSILRKYEGLRVRHDIVKIELDRVSDAEEARGVVCAARITLSIKIEGDGPRKVLQMLEWRKAEAGSPLDMCVAREVLVAQDARPLYHWSELPAPVGRSPHVLQKSADAQPAEGKDRGDKESGSSSGSEGDDEDEDEEEGDEENEDDDENREDEDEDEDEDAEEGDEAAVVGEGAREGFGGDPDEG